MYDHHSTIALLTESVFRTLARYQLGADELFERSGIALNDSHVSVSSIETGKITNFWHSVTELTDNPSIGFEIGNYLDRERG